MARLAAGKHEPHPDALPEWIKPQLTELVREAPEGPEWLHELKFDGYRMHARLDRGNVRLLTRTGLDWTHKYRAIAGGRWRRCRWIRLTSMVSCAVCGPTAQPRSASSKPPPIPATPPL